ncbi:MAG: dihydroorotate dehydrogenase (quinone) [Chloroflexota bacterium]
MYSALIRPLLFRLPPERAQRAADAVLRAGPAWRAVRPLLETRDTRLEVEVAGLRFPNPVGVAAGLDKDCRILSGLLDCGFGFATGGTVTLTARTGNPRPRLLREPAQRALVNALGFPGEGLDSAEARLRQLASDRPEHAHRVLVSVSGTTVDEIVECHRRLQRLAAGVEVNVSSPNTSGLRVFHDPDHLRELLEALLAQREKPLFVKLPPWPDLESRSEVLTMASAAASVGADGLVIANTHPVQDGRLAMGRGGRSGAPLFKTTLAMVSEARAELPRGLAIVACGGIGHAEHVWQLLQAGASAAQLYTAFVYEGPSLPGQINRGLLERMDRAGISHLPGASSG